MSKELVERLRHASPGPNHIATEAADTIEELMCDTQEVNVARIYLREKEGLLRELDASQKQNVLLREGLEEIGNTACGEASHQYIALTALAAIDDLKEQGK